MQRKTWKNLNFLMFSYVFLCQITGLDHGSWLKDGWGRGWGPGAAGIPRTQGSQGSQATGIPGTQGPASQDFHFSMLQWGEMGNKNLSEFVVLSCIFNYFSWYIGDLYYSKMAN